MWNENVSKVMVQFGLKFVLFDNKKTPADWKNNIPLACLSPTKANQQ